MGPFTGGVSYCKSCGCELDGDETRCSRCGFTPRQMGVRVALTFLLVVVVAMTGLMIPLPDGVAPLLLVTAAASFGLAVVTFVVAMIATPSRLGSLFAPFK